MTDHKDPSRKSDLTSIPLELDTELRLHPQQMNLGKAELLTDALTLPFTDIENRLGHFAMSASVEEKQVLRRSMKQYLGRLNANPHIPLKFRLKVLGRFEKELDLFDAEMTAAVLNAHKIGVMLVHEAARDDKSLYPSLIDMIANAIELAAKLVLINLQEYRAPAIIVTRQLFDLARLGLGVAAATGLEGKTGTARLNKALCNHELLRKLDFFSKTQEQQTIIWQELQHHIGFLEPQLIRTGMPTLHLDGETCMLINLNKPNLPGQIAPELSNKAEYDCIVIPLNAFIARIKKGVHSVETVLKNQQMQKKALHTESALEHTLTGGKAILTALQQEKRASNRVSGTESRIGLGYDLSREIIRLYSGRDSLNESKPDQAEIWNLVDINDHGLCLERMASGSMATLLGNLVGLCWPEDQTAAAGLGYIRWAREHKAGEQRIGIEFFKGHFILAKAVVLAGNSEMDEKRTWPVLIQPGETSHTIIFPETRVYRNMTFMILQGNKSAHFKIRAITESGTNFTQCEIVHAKAKN